MSTTATGATPAQVTGWDRTVVIALGAAGCVLSYDALQQMAAAIHVRGFLTYLFPLVVDGFIAYGVRALLVMRDAPLRARAYVWLLFGSATTASLWANALHAVRLNQLHAADGGLRLGDTVVAVLSTIAPLALAGAVHLYILIARRPVTPADRTAGTDSGQPASSAVRSDQPTTVAGRADGGHRAADSPVTTPPADRTALAGQQVSSSRGTASAAPASPSPVSLTKTVELRGHPVIARPVSDRPGRTGTAPASAVARTAPAGQPVAGAQVTDLADQVTSDRRTDLDTEGLLEIARQAVKEEEKLTRKVVASAIRGQQIPLSSDTLTQLMAQLRAQHGQQSVIADRN
ncbi:DUF2637 domain-containing protein [Kitasatospora sp. NPDC051914]|uniref:DUF2637 domain-containing protein n=1 Tax=Kitasatospora sp. NPDC051914 TaxID=3154945 RepID=UPI00343F8230